MNLKEYYKETLREQILHDKITEPTNATPTHYHHGKTRKPNQVESSDNGKRAIGIPKK